LDTVPIVYFVVGLIAIALLIAFLAITVAYGALWLLLVLPVFLIVRIGKFVLSVGREPAPGSPEARAADQARLDSREQMTRQLIDEGTLSALEGAVVLGEIELDRRHLSDS
jgi:hypothetical protein